MRPQVNEITTTGTMSQAKYYESYARYDDDKKRYETWDESVDRVMNTHKEYYKDKLSNQLLMLMDEVEVAYKDKLFLGSQRALQFGGEQLLKNHAKLFNCSSTYIDRVEVFGEIFFLMLSGCGVGFSVQKEHISSLPKLMQRGSKTLTYVVEDSIEGWAESADVLMSSFFENGGKHPEYHGCQIHFDLSKIRPKGALISGGFKAPGPDGLRIALGKIELLLIKRLEESNVLNSITAYDVIMHIADAVISGGVRRAATICLFGKDDEDMLKAKTGDWWVTNKQRGRSNNSCILLREDTTKEEFNNIMKSVQDYGEPGFIWSEHHDLLFNPCVTGDTMIMTNTGPKQVLDLIGKQFIALVNGKEYSTTEKGFWKTGVKDIYKLTLEAGLVLKLTKNHKVLTVRGWVELGDLVSTDKIIYHDHSAYEWNNFNEDDYNKGWLLGMLVGDGTFTEASAILKFQHDKHHLAPQASEYLTKYFTTYQPFDANFERNIIAMGSVKLKEFATAYDIKQNDKTPNNLLEEASVGLTIGYLRGLFDTDGSVQGGNIKGVSVRLTQTNLPILEQVQRMLLRYGIKSKIYRNRRSDGHYLLPDGKGGSALYDCMAVHELVISRNSVLKYNNIIGFSNIFKQNKLNDIISKYTKTMYKDNFYSSIKSVEYCGKEDVYDVTVPGPDAFDANGIYVHNCVEIGMYARTKSGISGVSFCNLTEINGAKSTSEDIFYKQCKVASIMGTLQAGYTNFKFLSPASKEIADQEALLGVSITGWMNNPEILFNPEILKAGAEITKYWNKVTAELIDIRQSARVTCVKPSGNASVLLGTASGIHGEHSPRYIRHVQFNKETEIAKLFMETNPKMVEQSVWGTTDIVVAFPIISKEGSIYKKDLLGVKQLEYVVQAQQHWVNNGRNAELCMMPYLNHNVSNTITVDDWDAVGDYIYDNRYSLGGVSLLSGGGDKAYTQAPFAEVLTHDEIIVKYGANALFTSALIEAAMTAFIDDLWNAINTALGYGEKLTDSSSDLLKRDFVRRFNKFATRFDNPNMCGDCLKDVYNLHKWHNIMINYKEPNWSENLTEKVYVEADTLVGAACSGGKCEI
jgi:ribonucleotide reductase, class II